MRRRICIETTIPSFYYEERPEPGMAARRLWTRKWRDEHEAFFDDLSSNCRRSAHRLCFLSWVPYSSDVELRAPGEPSQSRSPCSSKWRAGACHSANNYTTEIAWESTSVNDDPVIAGIRRFREEMSIKAGGVRRLMQLVQAEASRAGSRYSSAEPERAALNGAPVSKSND